MSNIPNAPTPLSEAKNYPQLGAGSHFARIYQIIDLGTQESAFGPKRIFSIRFETPTKKAVFDEEKGEQPFSTFANVTWSITTPDAPQKSKLTSIIEACGDKPEKGYNIFELLGKTCMVQMKQDLKDPEKYWADTFSQVSEEIDQTNKKFAPVNEQKWFFLGEFRKNVFDELGKKTQEKIALSPEYRAIMDEIYSNKNVDDTPLPEIKVDDIQVDDLNVQTPF
jgi:hypothetical protein